MRLPPKTGPATFWNGRGSSDPPSDIDHVLAASQVTFDPPPDGASVEINGWPVEPDDDAKAAWIAKYSDYAPCSAVHRRRRFQEPEAIVLEV